MSEKLLNPDEIAALFDQAAEGRLPEEAAESKETRTRARWLRTIDWTRPTKFTPDQENRLRRAHESFCRTAMTRLAAEHRIDLGLEVIDVSQHTWEDALRLVPKESLCATLEAKPIGTRLLLGVELPLLRASLEKLLGAATKAHGRERKLTEIDLVLLRRVFEALADSLSQTWEGMAGVRFSCRRIGPKMEARQVVAFTEPTLAIVMEARLDGLSATIWLLLPHASVAPVAAGYSKRIEDASAGGAAASAALRTGIGGVDVVVRAEVGELHLTLDRVLALRAGDVVGLGVAADADVEVYADEVAVHRAKPGRTGHRRAVQVTGPAEEEA
ncbi:MAG: FliM/FliN family flagellar motor switch protein [Actinomycetota bacterium]|nr:FliM/FliN family flagellar motor switch protein [Actinomycetota bacterium]